MYRDVPTVFDFTEDKGNHRKKTYPVRGTSHTWVLIVYRGPFFYGLVKVN